MIIFFIYLFHLHWILTINHHLHFILYTISSERSIYHCFSTFLILHPTELTSVNFTSWTTFGKLFVCDNSVSETVSWCTCQNHIYSIDFLNRCWYLFEEKVSYQCRTYTVVIMVDLITRWILGRGINWSHQNSILSMVTHDFNIDTFLDLQETSLVRCFIQPIYSVVLPLIILLL